MHLNIIFELWLISCLVFQVFHREIVSEMGELGVLGPTIKGKPIVNSSAHEFPQIK